MTAYDIAKEIAQTGNYCLLSEILDELRINWGGTYQDTLTELKANIEWNSSGIRRIDYEPHR